MPYLGQLFIIGLRCESAAYESVHPLTQIETTRLQFLFSSVWTPSIQLAAQSRGLAVNGGERDEHNDNDNNAYKYKHCHKSK